MQCDPTSPRLLRRRARSDRSRARQIQAGANRDNRVVQLRSFVERCYQMRFGYRTASGREQITDSNFAEPAAFLSPAKAAQNPGRDPRVTLAALAHPGLNSVAAMRLGERYYRC